MTIAPWLKGTALLVLTFASGIAVGVMYERRHTPPHQAVAMRAHDALHHLARELDLDVAQQQAISEILARHQSEVDATWHSLQPHLRATLDATAQEIAAVLRPDQAAKYRKMMEAMHPASPRH